MQTNSHQWPTFPCKIYIQANIDIIAGALKSKRLLTIGNCWFRLEPPQDHVGDIVEGLHATHLEVRRTGVVHSFRPFCEDCVKGGVEVCVLSAGALLCHCPKCTGQEYSGGEEAACYASLSLICHLVDSVSGCFIYPVMERRLRYY